MSASDAQSGNNNPRKDHLLAEDGLKSLLDQLAIHEENCAVFYDKLNDSSVAFVGPVKQLNEAKSQITSLLSKDRLGKSLHRQEETVCNAASELNKSIDALLDACSTTHTSTSLCHDPFTLARGTKFLMNQYLTIENNYERRCLEEQVAERQLEDQVFHVLQEITPEQEKIMSELMDKKNESLTEVEVKASGFDTLTNWTAFEINHQDQMAQEEEIKPIVLTARNHPDDAQFLEYQILQLENLHIYQKLQPASKLKTNKSLGGKLKRAITFTYHDYAARGTWTITSTGYLIEFDHTEDNLVCMFNLRKCHLFPLSPKDPVLNEQSDSYCYFTLHGQKVHTLSERKKRRMKEYKFRVPLGIAHMVHQELSKFCLSTQRNQNERL